MSDLACLQSAAEVLEDRQEPADRVFVIGALARLANHFRNERPADAWQMLFEDYAIDLNGISGEHLLEAISEHRKERSWFPKIAEIVERWQAMQRVEALKLRRARILMGLEDPKPWER